MLNVSNELLLQIKPDNLFKGKYGQNMECFYMRRDRPKPKKPKRFRYYYTTEQLRILENEFQTNQYCKIGRRRVLAHILNIPDKVLKIWFQNRRMKEKHRIAEDEQESNRTSALMKNRHRASIALMLPNNDVPNDVPKVSIKVGEEMDATPSNNILDQKQADHCESIPEFPDELFQQFNSYIVKYGIRPPDPVLQNDIALEVPKSSLEAVNCRPPVNLATEFYKQYNIYMSKQKVQESNPDGKNKTVTAAPESPMDAVLESSAEISTKPFNEHNNHILYQQVDEANFVLRSKTSSTAAESPIDGVTYKSSAEFSTELVKEQSNHIRKQQVGQINAVLRNDTATIVSESSTGMANDKSSAELPIEVFKQHDYHVRQEQIGQVYPVFRNETASVALDSPRGTGDYKSSGEFSTQLLNQHNNSNDKQNLGEIITNCYYKNEKASAALQSPKDMAKYTSSGEFSIELFKEFSNYVVRNENVGPINPFLKNESPSAAESSMQQPLKSTVSAQSPNEILPQDFSCNRHFLTKKVASKHPSQNEEKQTPLNLTKNSARPMVPRGSHYSVPRGGQLIVFDRPRYRQRLVYDRNQLLPLMSDGNRPLVPNVGQPSMVIEGQLSKRGQTFIPNSGHPSACDRVQPNVSNGSRSLVPGSGRPPVSVGSQQTVIRSVSSWTRNNSHSDNVSPTMSNDGTLWKPTQALPIVPTGVSAALPHDQIRSTTLTTVALDGTSIEGCKKCRCQCELEEQATPQATTQRQRVPNVMALQEPIHPQSSPPPRYYLNK